MRGYLKAFYGAMLGVALVYLLTALVGSCTCIVSIDNVPLPEELPLLVQWQAWQILIPVEFSVYVPVTLPDFYDIWVAYNGDATVLGPGESLDVVLMPGSTANITVLLTSVPYTTAQVTVAVVTAKPYWPAIIVIIILVLVVGVVVRGL
ncbi:MAG: hypothetical protein GXO43_00075 [Crenarchaeota archaeon]|nr:hypothetical protein [Thermoproteota archaeon]